MSDIKIKLVTQNDIKVLYDWVINEEQLYHFTCQPVEKFNEKYEDYLTRKIKLYKSEKSFEMIAFKDNENAPVGKISCFNINTRNKSAEIGYYLPINQRGKGYGSLILHEFVSFLFTNKEFNKVYATTSSNNIASIKILERIGFILDGKNREHYWIDGNRFDQLIYSLLHREWLEKVN